MKRAFIAGALLLLASCRVAGPGYGVETHDGSDTLTLRVGETVVWSDIDIGFTRVLEDNRCPIDVRCVWAGNAAIEIEVGPLHGTREPSFPLTLNTTLQPHAGEAWGIRVELLEVLPQPVSTGPTPAGAYVAKLGVERVER